MLAAAVADAVAPAPAAAGLPGLMAGGALTDVLIAVPHECVNDAGPDGGGVGVGGHVDEYGNTAAR